ncbi:MAG TPA: hypothetical protein VLZ81_12660 [Blastocatellia bacterium]|nr:hypothetical protein [Blastocatellia bacterium]
MINRKPRIGLEINAYCGKCKLERTHTVAAMEADGSVKKVSCTMCGSYHNYKLPKVASEGNGKVTKTGTRKSRSATSIDSLLDPSRPAKPYSMSGSFSAGDLINHPSFGLGAVELTRPPNKMEVIFREGRKTLVHNMPSQ